MVADQIPPELIDAAGKTSICESHKFAICITKTDELS
jgi:hypothetical protein